MRDPTLLEPVGVASRQAIVMSRHGLLFEYEATSLGEPVPNAASARPKSRQERAEELLYTASIALWLARPSPLQADFMVQFDGVGESPVLRQWGHYEGTKAHLNDNEARMTRADLDFAAQLHSAILELDTKAPVWVAVRLLWKSLIDKMWEVRIVMQCIALEALFGPQDAREITFRLSTRVGQFLGSTAASRKDWFGKTKEAYGWRSKVVHGSRLNRLSVEKSTEVSHVIEQIVRQALLKILGSADLKTVFEGDTREQFLDDLMFGNA
jgi:hypothetical protein